MNIKAIRTKKIIVGDDLEHILKRYVTALDNRDVIVVTSKIVSICEGRVVKNEPTVDKQKLIEKEADYFIEGQENPYHVTLTITRNTLIANAGIDESNGNGYFVLWPKDPFGTASRLWQYVRRQYQVNTIGILISDTQTTPQRWGTRGFAIAWCGFEPLKDYIGTPDIFGRKLSMTKASIIDGLAAAAIAVMGEGNEQTPLAVIGDVPFVAFQNHPPTQKDIDSMKIAPEDDLYAPILQSAPWKKGK